MLFNKNTTGGRILTQRVYISTEKKIIQTKIPAWSSWSWLQKMKMLKRNFTCQLKIVFCQNSNNVFWGYTNWLTSGRSFSSFLPNEILGNIRIPLVIQGCNKTPMCTQIPICTSWVGLPNENTYSEQSGNSGAPSLTSLPARTLNSNKKKQFLLFGSKSVFIQCGVVTEGGELGNYSQNLSKSSLW